MPTIVLYKTTVITKIIAKVHRQTQETTLYRRVYIDGNLIVENHMFHLNKKLMDDVIKETEELHPANACAQDAVDEIYENAKMKIK